MVYFDTNGFMSWAKEEFPGTLETHFNYDMLENLINWALENKGNDHEEFISFLTNIVPEITEDEWRQYIL